MTTILKSIDAFVFLATTSNSITLSLTRVELIAIPISSCIACGLAISKKVLYKMNTKKTSKVEKVKKKRDQQTIKSFDKLYRKSLIDNVLIKMKIKVCVIDILIILMKIIMNLFCKNEHKSKIKLF